MHASMQKGEDKPFQWVNSAAECLSSPAIPLKTILLAPHTHVANGLYLL